MFQDCACLPRTVCDNLPAVDALGQLRLKGPVFAGKRFDEVALAAPMYFEAVIKSSQYNQNVSERLAVVEAALKRQPPSRKPFLSLMKEICEMLTSVGGS